MTENIKNVKFNNVKIISFDYESIDKIDQLGSTIIGYTDGSEEQFDSSGKLKSEYLSSSTLGNDEPLFADDLQDAEIKLEWVESPDNFPSKLILQGEYFKLVYNKTDKDGNSFIYYGNDNRQGLLNGLIKAELKPEVLLKGLRFNCQSRKFEKFYLQYLFNNSYDDNNDILGSLSNAQISSYTEDYIINTSSKNYEPKLASIEIRPTNKEFIRSQLEKLGVPEGADQMVPYVRSSQRDILRILQNL